MNRKPTVPGGWERPAPGSVGPALPGSGAYTEDEVPTKPDAVDPDMLKLVRLFGDMPIVEQRRAVSMLEHYVRCPLGRRVLIEELARELARK